MVRESTPRQVGGSIGKTISRDIADRLHLEADERLPTVETETEILLAPYDPAVEEGLGHAARAARKYRNALRELAK